MDPKSIANVNETREALEKALVTQYTEVEYLYTKKIQHHTLI